MTTPLVVDPAAKTGTWEGWGVSLAWWANVFGDRDDVADLVFTTKNVIFGGQALPGLGLNIGRYNAGACSYVEVDGRHLLAPGIHPVRQMQGFWLDGKSTNPASGSWDWSVDERQRAMMLKAHERGATDFELFSNSPMWWMCANADPAGAAVATDDNLRPQQEQAFAIYLATIALHARDKWGVTFSHVEPFNEPISDYWHSTGRQEGCHFSPASQARVIAFLRQELDARGLKDMMIAASDNNAFSQSLDNWRAFDPATQALVGEINTHGYQYLNLPIREALHRDAVAEGKRLWDSEYGDGDPTGLTVAQTIDLDFHHLHPTAWCYWQALDGKGWGLVPANLDQGTTEPANEKYFVLAQYSRHIRRGMTILETGHIGTVAAFDPVAKKLVIVSLNQGTQALPFSVDLSKFASATGPVHEWSTETLGHARYEKRPDAPLKGAGFSCTLAPQSVATFEVDGVTGR